MQILSSLSSDFRHNFRVQPFEDILEKVDDGRDDCDAEVVVE